MSMTKAEQAIAIKTVRETGGISEAAKAAGVTRRVLSYERETDPAFARKINSAVAAYRKKTERRIVNHIKKYGRLNLAANSVGINRRTVLMWRKESEDFDRDVSAALAFFAEQAGQR